ncbi:hypothetical protein CUN85_01105 [Methanolobus halotolerans]|uniref:Uncharacterized protein n=2 Tax=Methanolobus halotolerans TaxID=2052935 RepID=A0A4E0Q9B0_9EURY|nr:hypothetical protein CUN85_01105 [Methanolobus halotolerans]
MFMLRRKYIVILAILVIGLVVSGCTEDISSEDEVVSGDTGVDSSIADNTLNQEMVGITDSEIQDLEAQIAELEALISGMDQEENISVEEM